MARCFSAPIFAALCSVSCFGSPDLVGRYCSEVDPCPDELVCQDNKCRQPCRTNNECASLNDQCVAGMCRPIGPATGDAGLPPDVCRNVDCTSPPPSECSEGDSVYHSYSDVGSCHPVTGECEYTEMSMSCPHCLATCLAPCESFVCDEARGGCRLDAFCVPGAIGAPPTCEYTNAEDGVDCTRLGAAGEELAGVCRAGECAECNVPEDCDDGNVCTDDMCDQSNGTCRHQNNTARCDDMDQCTSGPGTCSEGECVFASRVGCNTPPDDCHEAVGSCDPSSGACNYLERSNGTLCDDGNACTQRDTCRAGTCTGADPITCNMSPGQCFAAAGTCNPTNATCTYPAASPGTACVADNNICTADACDGNGACNVVGRAAPNGQSAVQTGTSVSMRWAGCTDAMHYDVAVEFRDTNGNWAFYYTYDENNPAAPTTNEKVFYPVTCDRMYRFRVRTYHGTVHDGWSSYYDFFFSC